MELARYVTDLQRQLAAAAEAGGDEARAVAERLASTLDSTARLVLLEALSEAASEITGELAPGSVDVRLRGRDPEFVVSQATTPVFEKVAGPSSSVEAPAIADAANDTDEGVTSRTTLRLPESLKLRVETAAARDGLSVNSWLVQAITAGLGAGDSQAGRPAGREARDSGNRFTGWVR